MAQMKVTGTVVSSEDGEPLYGVTVKVVGTGTGTTTDFNGAFNIEVKEKAVLEFSYIGMLPIKKTASPKMQIVMDPDQQNLDEVMVVAFGKAKKSAFTGSAKVVGAEKFARRESIHRALGQRGRRRQVHIHSRTLQLQREWSK